MRPSELLAQNREQIRVLSETFHFSNPRVFGSILMGKDTEESDLDLLVDPQEKTTLIDYCGLKDELESLLGIKVDLLTPRSLPEKFKADILQKAQPV